MAQQENHYLNLSAQIDAIEAERDRLALLNAELAALIAEVLKAGNANTRSLKSIVTKACPTWCKQARAALAKAQQ